MKQKKSVIAYNEFMAEALYGVIKKVLTIVSEEGIFNGHHFYIGFLTNYPGVIMPDNIKEQHEEELTIVLQHEFSNLQVNEDGFSVELNFNGQSVCLTVPYKALKLFADPSQSFNLEFSVDQQKLKTPSPDVIIKENVDDDNKIIDLIRFKDEMRK